MIGELISWFFYTICKSPASVQIEVTNRCNLNCKMCPRSAIGVEYADLPYSRFKEVIDKLTGVGEILLTGWGEPLLHPNIFDMIGDCKGRGFKTKLTTNGLLLDSIMQKKVVDSGLDIITFSVDSLSSNIFAHPPLSLKNIKELIALRKGKIPKVMIQTTLHAKRAEDAYGVIEWGAKEGADRVMLHRLDTRFSKDLERPNFLDEKEIFKTAEKLGKKMGIPVDFVPYAMFDGLTRITYKLLIKVISRSKICPKIYRHIYVNRNGEATPCCSLPCYKISTIKEIDDIREVWNSQALSSFRKNQKKICAGCDVLINVDQTKQKS